MDTHRERALDALAAVQSSVDHLDELHRRKDQALPFDSRQVAATYDEIRVGLKRAEVHALLAISEAIGAPR